MPLTSLRVAVVAVGFFLAGCSAEPRQAPRPEAATTKQALVTNFATGSLIIPMDNTSQNNGTLRAFGLMHRLLQANVPVHRVALTGKAQGATDFSAPVTQREGGAALGTVSYRAGPMVVAAADATPAALAIVDAYLAADTVTNVHVATAPFSADVQRTLVAAPRIAVLRDGFQNVAYGFLNAANILDSAGNAWSDTSPTALTLAQVAGVTGTTGDGVLLNADGTPAYEQLTSMHYDAPIDGEVVREVRAWLTAGPTTHAYMMCEAVTSFENHADGRFLSTLGMIDDGAAPNPVRSRQPDSLFAQFDGAFGADNGSVDSIGLAPGSTLYANSSVLMDLNGAALGTRMLWLTGFVDGNTNDGKVSYLGGHNYSTALPISTNPQTNGARLFLNSLYETPGLFSTGQPNLTFTKSAPALTNGATVTFTLAWSNTGTAPAYSVVLTDVLPAGTTFVSATGGGVHASGTVTWTVGAVAAGASGSVTVTVTAPEATLANSATLAYQVGATPKTLTSNGTSTVVDRTAPDTTLTSGPSGTVASTSATFTFTATEAGSTFACSLDGAAFTACTSPHDLAGLAQGSHTLAVRATDPAGNTDATPASRTWTVDTLAPDTSFTSTPPALTNATAATFSFTATEAGSTFECSLDGAAFTACTSPLSLTSLAEGGHTFAVRAVDAAGNVDATPSSFSWTVDSQAPDTTLTSGPSGAVASADAAFTFTSSEVSSTFECSLDGAAFAACSSPTSLTGLAEGAHTFAVRSSDAAGNTDATPATASWTVDTTPPDTSLTGAPTGTTNVSTATLDFSSPEAGVTFECSLDGATFAACTGPVSLTALTDGSHTFAVRAVDAAGNVDPTPASATWVVDVAVPDTTLTAGPSGAVASASATFEFTSSKPGSTFECSLDGAAFAACPSPVTFSALAEGSHTLEVRAVDAVGNVDPTPASRTWTVDTLAPDTAFTTTPPALSNDTTPSLVFSSPEAGATFECSLDGAAWSACASPLTTSALTDGLHVLLVRAVDAAGNFDATPARATFTVDTVAPASPLITEPVADATTGALPGFGGLAEPGSTVAVTVDGAVVCSATARADGSWSCTATTPLAAGPRSATAVATDGAGNASAPSTPRPFTVDASRPDTVIVSAPAALSNDTTADFTFVSDRAGATFECSLDGAAFMACAASATFTGLAEGAHRLEVRALDGALVDPAPAAHAWTVDTQAPAAPVVTAPAANATTSATPVFSGTAEPGSTVIVRVDGAPACTAVADASGAFACAAPSALPPGPHTVTASATDPADNTSPASPPVSFTVGTTPLDTAIIAGPSGTVSATSATFAFTSTVVGATFECSLDGAAFSACPTPVTFSSLAEGSHTLEVRAVNGADTDSTPASRTWVVDVASPAAPVVLTPADQAVVRTRTPRYSGTAVPGAAVRVSVDDQPVCVAVADSAGAWACTGTGALADGAHRVSAVATDAAGNVSAPSMVNRFTVDVPAMTVEVTAPADGSLTNDATPELRGTATPGSIVSVFVDGALVGTATADSGGVWSFTPSTPLADGARVVTARAELDGLMSMTSDPVTVTIDTRPPVVSIGLTQPAPEDIPGVTLAADEAPVTFTCSLDGAPFTPCTSPLDVSAAGDGEHTLVVRATDAAGNVGEASRTYVVTPPDGPEPLPPLLVRGGGCGCGSVDLAGVTLVALGVMLRRRRARCAAGPE